MSDTIQIGYIDDDIPQRYAKSIREAGDLEALCDVVDFYQPLTDDARKSVIKMTPQDFEQFKKDAKLANRAKGETAEKIVDRWGDILMPEKMIKVSMVANNFHAPFGTAFIKLQEAGKL